MIKGNGRKKYIDILIEVVLVIMGMIIMIPVYYLIVTTLKTPQEATNFPLHLPKNMTLSNYIVAWKAMNYPRAFLNTFIITSTSVIGIILVTSMAAYGFARKKSRFNGVIYIIILAGIMVPYQMSIVSLYKVVSTLKLMNKIIGVVLITISINVSMATFLFRNFIDTIPYELEEAAQIDGCSVMRTFWQITFPLLKPVIATVAILTTLTVWNDFMTPLLFLQKRKNAVILLEVFRNVGQFSVDWTKAFPMMTLGIMPLMIFYLIMQKYIIKGVVTGSIKG